MSSTMRRRWIVVVLAVSFVAIASGYAALRSPSAAVGKTLTCCCSGQCVAATNGKCPVGCRGPWLICPDACRP
jgi:hypothetical protein